MPIPELVALIRVRAQVKVTDPEDAYALGVLSGRLIKEYERAEALQCSIDDCLYYRCPCQ